MQEWSSAGISNQPSNPNFWSNATWNAGRAGLGGLTAGGSEIIIGTGNYLQTGNAAAFQQQMGGLAASNLAGAASIKIGQSLKTTSNIADGKITGYTRHGLNQAIGREGTGVSSRAILGAVKNPAKIVQQSGGKIKYIGQNATVITSAKGKIITTWPNGSGGLRSVGVGK